MRNTSLQVKITFIFVTMTLFILTILGVTFYSNTIDTLKESKEKEMTTIAIETANKIERFLFERSADIKVLSESKILTMTEVQDRTRHNFLMNVMGAYQTYDSIFVVDLEGNVILSTGKVPEIKKMREIFAGTKAYISDIFEQSNGENLIFFSRPLINEAGIHVGGVVEVMNFNSIKEIVENVSIGETGYAQLKITEFITDMGQNEGMIEIIDDGIHYISVKAPVQVFQPHKAQGHVQVFQAEEEAYRVIDDFIKYLLLVLFVIFILFTFLSIVISRLITEPIRNLMDKMNQLMKDNKRYNMKNQAKDEIENLTFSFDILFEQLNFMMQMVLEKTGQAAYMDEINEHIKEIFESIPNGILTIDAKGDITSINQSAAQILKLSDENQKHLSIYDTKVQRLRDFLKALENSLFNDIKYRGEICYISDKQEGLIPIIFNTLRQTDQNGALIGMTVIMNDLEEKKRFQERIFKAKRLSELGELSAGVAHEIRNPLASIKGYAQLVRMELNENDQSYKDLSIVLNEVERLDRIIERFMAFARPSQLVKTWFSMGDLIDETIKLIGNEFVKNQVSVRFIRCKNDRMMIDYEQMKQVLINILINGIQASSRGDEILVKTSCFEEKHLFLIEIIDQGDGIKEEMMDKIFTPFYTTREKGSGLGLSISTRIVENHKGILEIDNSLDKGTRVLIKLPMKGGLK